MNKPGSQRLFFALWPSEAQQRAIEALVRPTVAASGGRAIAARNLHATLVFLGEVTDERLPRVMSAAAAVHGRAFGLTFDRIESWRKSGVLALVASEVPAPLREGLAQLRTGLEAEGFVMETRPFNPHVTLARKVVANQALELENPITWRLEEFVLVRSRPGADGSEYTVLRRWALSGV